MQYKGYLDNNSTQERTQKETKIFKIRSGGARTHACARQRSISSLLYGVFQQFLANFASFVLDFSTIPDFVENIRFSS